MNKCYEKMKKSGVIDVILFLKGAIIQVYKKKIYH